MYGACSCAICGGYVAYEHRVRDELHICKHAMLVVSFIAGMIILGLNVRACMSYE